MLTNIAAAQITPDEFIAAGNAGLEAGARPAVASRLELVADTIMAIPYRGRVMAAKRDTSPA
jgi:hypothetical protein